MPDPLTLKTASAAAESLGKAVAAILSVVTKLKAQPDEAASDLATALNEVAKTHEAVRDGINRYLIVVDNPKAFDEGLACLLAIGGLGAEIERGLGSCHRIAQAYRENLDHWFSWAIDPTEAVLMRGTFQLLGDADRGLFRELASVGALLDRGAADAIAEFREHGPNAARARLREDFDDLLALRNKLLGGATSLRELENTFNTLASGVPSE